MTVTGSAPARAPGGLVPRDELKRLTSWPGEVARSDLAAYFTFSLEDLRWLRRHRGAGERIGLAVQLAALRFLGFIPDELAETPARSRGTLPSKSAWRPRRSRATRERSTRGLAAATPRWLSSTPAGAHADLAAGRRSRGG